MYLAGAGVGTKQEHSKAFLQELEPGAIAAERSLVVLTELLQTGWLTVGFGTIGIVRERLRGKSADH